MLDAPYRDGGEHRGAVCMGLALVAGVQRSGTLINCEDDKVYVARPVSMLCGKLKVSYFTLLVPSPWLCLWRLP
jgi:hypothetical protein